MKLHADGASRALLTERSSPTRPAAFPLSVPCVFGSVGARAVRVSEKVFQDSTVPWLLG